jgi:hypothetical protein
MNRAGTQVMSIAMAFVAGAIAAAYGALPFSQVRAQGGSPKVVVACASAERTLRLLESEGTCQPGEERIVLKHPELEDPKKETPCEAIEQRVAALEKRAKDGTLTGSKVRAPFEVLREDGKPVLTVDDLGLELFNRSGKPVATLVAGDGMTSLNLLSGIQRASLMAGSGFLGVDLREDEKLRLTAGRIEGSNYSLQIKEPGGKLVAGIGQAVKTGNGAVSVFDKTGNGAALMYVQPATNSGIVEVVNAGGIAVASLWTGEGGDGRLHLRNSSGQVMVEAGVTVDGIGVVRTGPHSFNPGIGFLGLPGSYIAGKAK